MKQIIRKLGAVSVLGFLILLFSGEAKGQSLLLSDFTMSSDGSDALGNSPPMQLYNVLFTNGVMEMPGTNFSTPLATLNGFSYDSFSLAVDFNPKGVGYPHATILSGGPAYRWLTLLTLSSGYLELALNNFNLVEIFTNVVIQPNAWHTVACSVDLPSQTIITFFDGQHLPDIHLQNFQFEVASTTNAIDDQQVSFWNYGIADGFAGLAANLRVYSQGLTAAQMVEELMPSLTVQLAGETALVSWSKDAVGFDLQEIDVPGGTNWTKSVTAPIPVGNQMVVVESVTGAARFYRLKKQL